MGRSGMACLRGQAIRGAYLHLPDALPQRVRDLTHRVTSASASAYATATRIQDYLRAAHEYRREEVRLPPGRDVVDYFRFDAPHGFCSHFASAMAVMLRVEPIPARGVSGFATGDWKGVNACYGGSISAAHAWVEVYFPTYGWIEFEPAPARSRFDYAPTEPAGLSSSSGAGAGTSDEPVRLVQTAASGIVFAALIGLGVAMLLRRDRARRRLGPDTQLRLSYGRMRRTLAEKDDPRRQAVVTPDEFVARHRADLANFPNLRRAVLTLTSLYVAAAYTPRRPRPEDVGLALRARQAAWWEALRHRWRGVRRRPGPS